MTTIAYDGRYIAADGRQCIESTIFDDDTNKFYYSGANLFVLCGRTSDCINFAKEFKEGEKCEYKNAGGFLFVDGIVYIVFPDEDNEKYTKNILTAKYWADGSGRDWAVAAMDHGKSALEAVKYATTRDSCSGGKIRLFDTETCKFVEIDQ